IEPGPSSLSNSVIGKSSIRTGLISSELARALNDKLQVTSGDDIFSALLEGSMENTVLSCLTGLAFLASSMTWARLSLSMTVRTASGGCLGCCCDLFLRRLRARSPSEGASSCADAANGNSAANSGIKTSTQSVTRRKLGSLDRMISVAEGRIRAQRVHLWRVQARWKGKEVTEGTR